MTQRMVEDNEKIIGKCKLMLKSSRSQNTKEMEAKKIQKEKKGEKRCFIFEFFRQL